MGKWWTSVKQHVWKFVGALISDTKPDGQVAVSLGRVCFLAVLVFMFILWRKSMYSSEVVMPPGLMEVFYCLAGYVFGTKAIEAGKNFFGKGNGNSEEYSEEE